MLNKESTAKDILDLPLGGTTIREMGSMSFLAWVANRIDGAPTYKAATQELLGLIRNAPIGKMADEEKIRVVRKLIELEVNI